MYAANGTVFFESALANHCVLINIQLRRSPTKSSVSPHLAKRDGLKLQYKLSENISCAPKQSEKDFTDK
jgi:hypothetical protein